MEVKNEKMDPVLESPTHPHFFQPLLPNFHSHLSIPVKFFKLHLEGLKEIKTVELRSDACERTWKVKLEGRRLTFGWKEFTVAHDFRVGDFVIFRHQGGLMFHVTGFGPSCCEIQYVHSSNNEDAELDDDEDEKRSNFSMKQPVKTEPGSSLSENTFVKLNATPASLKRGRLYLPKSFTKFHKLENKGGKTIALLDKNGVEWPVKLVMDKIYTRMSLESGLREFIKANDTQVYESFVLELVWKDTKTPMFKFCSTIKT